jgi:hypothetical protein
MFPAHPEATRGIDQHRRIFDRRKRQARPPCMERAMAIPIEEDERGESAPKCRHAVTATNADRAQSGIGVICVLNQEIKRGRRRRPRCKG